MTFDLDANRLFILACALLLAIAAYALGYRAGFERGVYGPKRRARDTHPKDGDRETGLRL